MKKLGYNYSAFCKKYFIPHIKDEKAYYTTPTHKYAYACCHCFGNSDHLPVLIDHLRLSHGIFFQQDALFKQAKKIAVIIRDNCLPLECLGQK